MVNVFGPFGTRSSSFVSTEICAQHASDGETAASERNGFILGA